MQHSKCITTRVRCHTGSTFNHSSSFMNYGTNPAFFPRANLLLTSEQGAQDEAPLLCNHGILLA